MKAFRTIIVAALVVLVIAAAVPSIAAETEHERAPDFSLSDHNGKVVSLEGLLQNYRGAVLAFYPKNDTRN